MRRTILSLAALLALSCSSKSTFELPTLPVDNPIISAKPRNIPITARQESLVLPEEIRVTNHGSQEVIYIVWDQDHDDSVYQTLLFDAVSEVAEKRAVQLINLEGFYGKGDTAPKELADIDDYVKVAFHLSNIEFFASQGILSYGVDPFMSNAQFVFGLYDIYGGIIKKLLFEGDDCYNKSKKENECYRVTEAADLFGQLQKEVSPYSELKIPTKSKDYVNTLILLRDLGDKVGYASRSYTAVDETLNSMLQTNERNAILIFGAAHAMQISGYLDYLGITHVDVIMNKALFDQRQDELKRLEVGLHFSEDSLDWYRLKKAEGAFNQ